MPYKSMQIEAMLTNKLKMVIENNDHVWFILQLDGLPTIRTKVSHNRQDINDFLEGKISKQLRVRTKFFRELMDCTKSKQEYEEQIKSDPFPPFSQLLL